MTATQARRGKQGQAPAGDVGEASPQSSPSIASAVASLKHAVNTAQRSHGPLGVRDLVQLRAGIVSCLLPLYCPDDRAALEFLLLALPVSDRKRRRVLVQSEDDAGAEGAAAAAGGFGTLLSYLTSHRQRGAAEWPGAVAEPIRIGEEEAQRRFERHLAELRRKSESSRRDLEEEAAKEGALKLRADVRARTPENLDATERVERVTSRWVEWSQVPGSEEPPRKKVRVPTPPARTESRFQDETEDSGEDELELEDSDGPTTRRTKQKSTPTSIASVTDDLPGRHWRALEEHIHLHKLHEISLYDMLQVMLRTPVFPAEEDNGSDMIDFIRALVRFGNVSLRSISKRYDGSVSWLSSLVRGGRRLMPAMHDRLSTIVGDIRSRRLQLEDIQNPKKRTQDGVVTITPSDGVDDDKEESDTMPVSPAKTAPAAKNRNHPSPTAKRTKGEKRAEDSWYSSRRNGVAARLMGGTLPMADLPLIPNAHPPTEGEIDYESAQQQQEAFERKDLHEWTTCQVLNEACSVCLRRTSSLRGAEMVFCAGCSTPVHRCCYGLDPDTPVQLLNFRCDLCRSINNGDSPDVSVPCAVCPWKGGAMRKLDDGRWIHQACINFLRLELKNGDGTVISAGSLRLLEERDKEVKKVYKNPLKCKICTEKGHTMPTCGVEEGQPGSSQSCRAMAHAICLLSLPPDPASPFVCGHRIEPAKGIREGGYDLVFRPWCCVWWCSACHAQRALAGRTVPMAIDFEKHLSSCMDNDREVRALAR